MAKIWYSLRSNEIIKRAKTFDTTLAEDLAVMIRGMPQSRGEILADKNWKPPSGKGTAKTRAWMIKVTERNHNYLLKPESKRKYGTPKPRVGGKELIYETEDEKGNSIDIVFRKTGRLEKTVAGTLEQEQGSAYIFRQVLNSAGPRWRSWQDIVEDTPVYNRLLQIFDGDVPDEWLSSYYAQSEVIFNKYSPGPYKEFGEDIPDGFMGFITKVVKDNFDKEYNLGGNKDNWNPADIWIIKGSQQTFERMLEGAAGEGVTRGTQTIMEFNDLLRALYKRKLIMGVSLKKVAMNKAARWEEVNMDKNFVDTGNINNNYKDYTFECNFELQSNDAMTQDVKMSIGEPVAYTFQIKAVDSQKNSNLKFEGTKKGASAARLGKATTDFIVELLDDATNNRSNFKNDWTRARYPNTRADFVKKTNPYNDEFWKGQIQSLLPDIKKDTSSITRIMNNFRKSYGKDPKNTRAKLMGLDFFNSVINDINTKPDRNEFVTDMVYIAQKKATTKKDHYGPFLKVY